MTKLDFYINNIQSVLYIDSFPFGNKISTVTKINNSVRNLFDGDPTLLDIPIDAPPEIPRIQLRDQKKNYSLNLTPIRIDLFFNDPGKPSRKLDDLEKEYFEYLYKIVNLVKNEYKVTIDRLAVVFKLISEVEGDATLFIYRDYLCNKTFFKDSIAFEIHSYKRESINRFDINQWFRIKTGSTIERENSIIFLEVDINTVKDHTKDYKEEDVRAFCENAIEYAGKNAEDCFGASI